MVYSKKIIQSLYWDGNEAYHSLIQSVGYRLGTEGLLLRQGVSFFKISFSYKLYKDSYALKFSFFIIFIGTSCCVDNAKEVNPATVMTAHAHKVAKSDGQGANARHLFVVREVLRQNSLEEVN